MALERKESKQRNCEASINCLQNNGIPFSLQHSVNSVDGFQEHTDEINCHASNDIPQTNHPLVNNFIERPNEFHNKPAYQHNSGSWPAFHFDSQKVQQCQMSASERQFCSFPVDNRFQHVPFKMFEQNYHCDLRLQEFQYFVVIDFEATCDKEKNPHPQEIIEFPSVLVNSVTGVLEACFQTYVRPTFNQLLSDFCRDLTGIQQFQVDRGVTLHEALFTHDKWLESRGVKNTNFAVVTWSNWDCRVMLESECRFKKIRKPPYFNRWINLKIPFGQAFGGQRCNLKEAVEMAGLPWEGRAHCGLDDAKNTARLVTLLMQRGFRLSITNSLMWQTSECPLQWKQQFPEAATLPPQPAMKPKPMHLPCVQYYRYCFCGVRSNRGMIRKPGPKQGSFFFGCGKWTSTKGASCQYFEWASP